MQIDQLVISTQVRNSWKSFDLGIRMAMTWWRPLYGFLFVVTLPIFVLCNFIHLEYGIFILWWLKPLFERGLLFIFSRQVFGQNITATDALKAWPNQLKLNWFQSISWRRFSTTRGFDLAVTQLEHLTGNKRSSRLSVLHQTSDDNSTWWMIICVHWELFILMGLFVLMDMLVPSGIDFNFFEVLSSESMAVAFITNLFTYLSILLIAPIYIGGSFAAYLNRRIILEGWDIELSFKKLNQNNSHNLASILLVLFTLGCGLQSPEVSAQQASQTSQEKVVQEDSIENEEAEPLIVERHELIKRNLQDVMHAPPFNQNETVTSWRWTGWKWDYKPEKSPDMSAFAKIIAFIAQFMEVILWVVFVSLLIWLLWLSRFRLASLFNWRIPAKNPMDIPTFGQHLDPKEIPGDIPSELIHLLNQQAYRQALSLMLVGSLMSLQTRKLITLNKAMTEQQCLAAINSSLEGEGKDFMVELINTWVCLAWAHRWPSAENMHSLCTRWTFLFAHQSAQGSL
jgi:hypothetical protein